MTNLRIGFADWTAAELLAPLATGLRSAAFKRARRERVAMRFAQLTDARAIHLLNSGTTALYVALASVRRRRGVGDVITPSYVCPSVPRAIEAAGLVPRFVDIGADLNIDSDAARSALSPRTVAMVVPHMYGCPAAIGALERVCMEAGVALIDDAAQVVGERIDGRALGSFGQFGIVSFAQSKAIVCGRSGAGGLLMVNDADVQGLAAEVVRELPVGPWNWRYFIDFVATLLGNRVHPSANYYWERSSAWLIKPPPPVLDALALASDADLAIVEIQLARLNAITAERHRIADLYAGHLPVAAGYSFPQYAKARFLSRVMLLMPEGVPTEEVRSALRARGFVGRMAYPAFGDAHAAPRAFPLRERMLEAPAYRGISEASVRSFLELLARTTPR